MTKDNKKNSQPLREINNIVLLCYFKVMIRYPDTEQFGRILSTAVEVTLRLTVSQSVCFGPGYFTSDASDGRSASISWNRAPLRDLRPDITSGRNVTV
jgi:hypothetical protein